jgi:hypothetical protein
MILVTWFSDLIARNTEGVTLGAQLDAQLYRVLGTNPLDCRE